MRNARWSAAAFVLLLSGAVVGLAGPAVRAADTVTMGSDAEPFALKFFPAEITVPVGSTIKWENKSDLQHDVAAQNGSFKSPLLNKGQTFEFKFTTPGDFPYVCTPHEDAGMKGVVKVVGGSTPTTAATTSTTQAPGGGATTTTARPGQPTTTTTAAKNAAGSGATTTTSAGAADPGVTTTSGPATTPTSAPDVAGETTTTAGHGTEEAAAGGDHASRGGAEEKKKSSPLGIAFAGISTVILAGITGKLLASRS